MAARRPARHFQNTEEINLSDSAKARNIYEIENTIFSIQFKNTNHSICYALKIFEEERAVVTAPKNRLKSQP